MSKVFIQMGNRTVPYPCNQAPVIRISISGGKGVGKTTVQRIVAEALHQAGLEVATRDDFREAIQAYKPDANPPRESSIPGWIARLSAPAKSKKLERRGVLITTRED